MFISKKRFNEAIKEAQEKAFMEAGKARWQHEETERLREQIRDLDRRLEAVENKGKKRFKCPCAVFPRNF
jgi:ubiquinone biosynthesis protein UbiJ